MPLFCFINYSRLIDNFLCLYTTYYLLILISTISDYLSYSVTILCSHNIAKWLN